MTPRDISVVIPTINEEATIAAAVGSARAAGATEIIVVDGGSDDQTADRARAAGATKFVHSIPGRGIQLNSGALLAEREWLLFLHADSQLGEHCLQQICQQSEVTWGAFRQRIDSPRFIFRTIEWGNALRVRLRKMPFGDQAMFVRRDVFHQQGSFAEIPLMEDVELSGRLRKLARPLLLEGPVTISARRWVQNGPIRQTLRNWSIQVSYAMGSTPESLKKRYNS